jgi:hypothetical protein
MSGILDNAMDQAHSGVWPQWRQNFGDLTGLEAAHAARAGDLAPMDPAQILNNQYAVTPMYRTAEAAKTIQGKIPQPYNVNTPALAATTGLLGGFAGHYYGGVEPGVEGFLMGGAVPVAGSMLGSTVGALARGKVGQNVLRNMDPRMVAALLAQQGIRPKGAPAEQPQGAGQ